jgi:hypothetical protein
MALDQRQPYRQRHVDESPRRRRHGGQGGERRKVRQQRELSQSQGGVESRQRRGRDGLPLRPNRRKLHKIWAEYHPRADEFRLPPQTSLGQRRFSSIARVASCPLITRVSVPQWLFCFCNKSHFPLASLIFGVNFRRFRTLASCLRFLTRFSAQQNSNRRVYGSQLIPFGLGAGR